MPRFEQKDKKEPIEAGEPVQLGEEPELRRYLERRSPFSKPEKPEISHEKRVSEKSGEGIPEEEPDLYIDREVFIEEEPEGETEERKVFMGEKPEAKEEKVSVPEKPGEKIEEPTKSEAGIPEAGERESEKMAPEIPPKQIEYINGEIETEGSEKPIEETAKESPKEEEMLSMEELEQMVKAMEKETEGKIPEDVSGGAKAPSPEQAKEGAALINGAIKNIESSPEAQQKAAKWGGARGILSKILKGAGWAAIILAIFGLGLVGFGLEKVAGAKKKG